MYFIVCATINISGASRVILFFNNIIPTSFPVLQEVQVAETGNSFVSVAEDTPTDPDLTTGKKDVFLVDVRTFKLRNDFCFLRVYINKTWVQKKAFSFFDVCM